MQENIEKINKNTTNLAISGSHLGACCMIVSRGGAFFWRHVFLNLRGAPPRAILDPPWSDFGPPLGAISLPLELFWHPANFLGTSTRQSSETVGQIGECHSNTSQTHDVRSFKSLIKWVGGTPEGITIIM